MQNHTTLISLTATPSLLMWTFIYKRKLKLVHGYNIHLSAHTHTHTLMSDITAPCQISLLQSPEQVTALVSSLLGL